MEDLVKTLFGADADVSFIEVETTTVGDTVVELRQRVPHRPLLLVVLGDTFFASTCQARGQPPLWFSRRWLMTLPLVYRPDLEFG